MRNVCRYFIFFAYILTLGIIIVPSAFGQTPGLQTVSGNEQTVIITKGAGGNLEEGDTSQVIGTGQDCLSAQNCFSPSTLVVDVGETVTWFNNDTVGHTVTNGQYSDNQTGIIFDSHIIIPEKEFSFTFQNSGVYDYFCQIHPWMTGAVIVRTTSETSTEINNSSAIAVKVNIKGQDIETKTIDNSVAVHLGNRTEDSVSIIVSAPDKTNSRVILINLENNTINIANLRYLEVEYDSYPIQQAASVGSILHAKASDDPSYVIIATQGGAKILVLIPYFSTHIITITNLTNLTLPVPEFPTTELLLAIALIPILLYAAITKVTNLNQF